MSDAVITVTATASPAFFGKLLTWWGTLDRKERSRVLERGLTAEEVRSAVEGTGSTDRISARELMAYMLTAYCQEFFFTTTDLPGLKTEWSGADQTWTLSATNGSKHHIATIPGMLATQALDIGDSLHLQQLKDLMMPIAALFGQA